MAATITEQMVHALEIVKEEEIAAPIGMLEQIGPENEAPGNGPMPMKLEAWSGGRWYRDLGNDADTSGATYRQLNRQHCSKSADLCLCHFPPSRTCSTG
jgi:hypothetical protein